MALYHTTNWAAQLLGALRKEIAVRKASDKQHPKVFVAPNVYKALVKHIGKKLPLPPPTDDHGTPLPQDELAEQLMIDGCLVTEVRLLDDGLVVVVNGSYAKQFEDEWRKDDATQVAEVPRRGVPGDSPVQGTEGNDEDV